MTNDIMEMVLLQVSSVPSDQIQYIVVVCCVTRKCVAKAEWSNEQIGTHTQLHSKGQLECRHVPRPFLSLQRVWFRE